MSECQRFQYLVELKLVEEISPQELIELEHHLRECRSCLKYYASSEKVKSMLDQAVLAQPSDELLNDARNSMSHVLRKKKRPKEFSFQRILNFISEIIQTPQWRFGFVLLLMVFSFSSGFFINSSQPMALKADNVFFAGIEHIDHSPSDQTVTLMYRTIQEHIIKGKSSAPEIQEFLIKTLLTDTRDSVRLRAVQTLSLSSSLTDFAQHALLQTLGEEENTAIKLKAIKMVRRFINKFDRKHDVFNILGTLALKEQNTAVQNELVKSMILLNDPNIFQTVQRLSKSVDNDFILSIYKQNQKSINTTEKEQVW
jgi:hypothetical protein